MMRTGRVLAAALTGTAVLALGVGTATASAAVTVSGLPSSAPLVDKLYVPLAVRVVCGPYEPSLRQFSSVSVTIRQVQGRQIAHGTGYVERLTCDGAAHRYGISVFPDSGFGGTSPPFRKGAAVVSAEAFVALFNPATGSEAFESAGAGPQPIKLIR